VKRLTHLCAYVRLIFSLQCDHLHLRLQALMMATRGRGLNVVTQTKFHSTGPTCTQTVNLNPMTDQKYPAVNIPLFSYSRASATQQRASNGPSLLDQTLQWDLSVKSVGERSLFHFELSTEPLSLARRPGKPCYRTKTHDCI